MISYITFLISLATFANRQCNVDIKSQLNQMEPLFLRKNELWTPNGRWLQWKTGEATMIACPGNRIRNTGKEKAYIRCVSGRTFTLGASHVNIANIACVSKTTGKHRNSGTSCGSGGTLLSLGFNVPGLAFITYLETCYNMQTASVLFTRHTIRGSAINYAITKTNRSTYKPDGAPANVPFAAAYTQKQQLGRVTDLLGSAAQAKRFISSGSFLERGHMVPFADGIFRPWRWVTDFYVNVAPQWVATNRGNWKAVEAAARQVAGRLEEDVLVFTGVYDILTLPHVNGHQVPITLDAKGIEIPKWLWKIVKSIRRNAAIALVTNNDPFRRSMPAGEMLCQDICAQYGWGNAKYDKFASGFTYCCTVKDLRRFIPTISSEADAANVLHF
ncbi:uncharacterized protein LOC121600685 [Anopheles merus]|uniref:uncharacterized protein LOC121600685 n=1 Tax=Anopheles merus TaxID=30066 RepID=UPI001BE47FE4|nr:uncharacterized protein LOC121600685 [Anopheles merus]